MNKKAIHQLIREALCEDIQTGDVTTNSLVSKAHLSKAVIFSKEPAVLCGLDISREVFHLLNKNIKCQMHAIDGQSIQPFKPIMTLQGQTRTLLTGERTALNFLSYLSAIATKTQQFVQRVPASCKILDTRKTTPTLRWLERYAVRKGGGCNHRLDLSEMAMIKDNHWLIAGAQNIGEKIQWIRKHKNIPIELEVDNLKQFKQALQWNVDIILLDNMPVMMIKKAVSLRQKFQKKVLLEVSGGISLGNVKRYAATGVDRISIGGLTHSRSAIDFSMEILTND